MKLSQWKAMFSRKSIKKSKSNVSVFFEPTLQRFVEDFDLEKETNGESKESIQLKSLKELSKDLERVLNPESSRLPDVTLKCGDASIPAHKIILSARSPVFAAMFSSPMKESFKNEVGITDIDEPVLRAMLKFMYTGKVPDFTFSLAADLLFAADKYQLQDLKAVCQYFLKGVLSEQNVWKILVLGDMHFADLKSLAVNYISEKCGDFSDIKKMQEYKALRKERPNLAMELLECLVLDRDEKNYELKEHPQRNRGIKQLLRKELNRIIGYIQTMTLKFHGVQLKTISL